MPYKSSRDEYIDYERKESHGYEGKCQASIRKARTQLTTDIGVEPIGNEEFVPIVKKDYGFDWDNRKFLVCVDYQLE